MRTLKPSFFTNELLLEIEPLGRLLFQGLWCLADREGRLEDRPGRIKHQVLPGDPCDIDGLLDALATRGFILRYGADGRRCIQVLNFAKHQTPHAKEQASRLPAPDMPSADPVLAPDMPSASTLLLLDPDSGIPELELGVANATTAHARETPAAPSVVVDQPYALWEALCEESGSDPAAQAPAFRTRQLAVAKRLLQQGYGEDTVRRCVRYLKSQDWRTSPIDLLTVEKEAGKWELAGSPATAMPARASPGRRGNLSTQAVADEIDAVRNGAVTHDDGSIETWLQPADGRLAKPIRDPG
jgi:hypothetical protein